jgi:hypothetical protein
MCICVFIHCGVRLIAFVLLPCTKAFCQISCLRLFSTSSLTAHMPLLILSRCTEQGTLQLINKYLTQSNLGKLPTDEAAPRLPQNNMASEAPEPEAEQPEAVSPAVRSPPPPEKIAEVESYAVHTAQPWQPEQEAPRVMRAPRRPRRVVHRPEMQSSDVAGMLINDIGEEHESARARVYLHTVCSPCFPGS